MAVLALYMLPSGPPPKVLDLLDGSSTQTLRYHQYQLFHRPGPVSNGAKWRHRATVNSLINMRYITLSSLIPVISLSRTGPVSDGAAQGATLKLS